MRYPALLIIASIVVAFHMNNPVHGFQFSLPGNWVRERCKRTAKWNLPGTWGTVGLSTTEYKFIHGIDPCAVFDNVKKSGQWGNGGKRSFSFTMPGQWGSHQRKRGQQPPVAPTCEFSDIQTLQGAYEFLKMEMVRLEYCMQYVSSAQLQADAQAADAAAEQNTLN